MAHSDYVLGRRASKAAFRECGQTGNHFIVSAYAYRGGVRYTDPVTTRTSSKSRISYRLRVYPRRGVYA